MSDKINKKPHETENYSENTTVIGKNIKLGIKEFIGIVSLAITLSGIWFSIHNDIQKVNDTLNGIRNESLRVSEANEYILRAQVANKGNNVVIPDLDTVIHRNTQWTSSDNNSSKDNLTTRSSLIPNIGD